MPYRTIIIDDESLARKRISTLLEEFPTQFEIIDEASDGLEALKKIEEQKPDLIFLDIEMPFLNGFELLQKLLYQPIVIFCTAFDHFALKAFETHSIDYLLKPVEKERLELTIKKLKQRNSNSNQVQELMNHLKNYLPKEEITTIPCKVGNGIKLIKLEDVVYFEADNKHIILFIKNGKKFFTENNLKELEEKLPSNFVRVSKAVLINKSLVLELKKFIRGKFVLIMDDFNKTQIITGANYTENLNKIIKL